MQVIVFKRQPVSLVNIPVKLCKCVLRFLYNIDSAVLLRYRKTILLFHNVHYALKVSFSNAQVLLSLVVGSTGRTKIISTERDSVGVLIIRNKKEQLIFYDRAA